MKQLIVFSIYMLLIGYAMMTQAQEADTVRIVPRVITESVITDADDPAIWVHPTDSDRSLVLGTDKGSFPDGGIFVWNLNGQIVQRVNISYPNGIDLRQNVLIGDQLMDLAVVSMRDHDELRVFRIDPSSGWLSDITSENQIHTHSNPYGLTCYKNRNDGKFYVFVTSRDIQFKEQIQQIHLYDDGFGKVTGSVVRIFGDHTRYSEGMVADDETGYLFVAEQTVGIYQYYADPDKHGSSIYFFGDEVDIQGNREGIAIYTCPSGEKYLLVSNTNQKAIRIYLLLDEPLSSELLAIVINQIPGKGDGIDACSVPLSRTFPSGIIVWHNQDAKSFNILDWNQVGSQSDRVCMNFDPLANITQKETVRIPGDQNLILYANYPNPFNNNTILAFYLEKPARVITEIHNLLGQVVTTFPITVFLRGDHMIHWNGVDDAGNALPSGRYFCVQRSDTEMQTRVMILQR